MLVLMSRAVKGQELADSRTGQRFTCVGAAGHVTRDGRLVYLDVWRSNCWECGASFEQKTAVPMLAVNKRCREHRLPGIWTRAKNQEDGE
jgi:hypothetical protein